MATSHKSDCDITRCSLCSEIFNVPKILPCLHSFCEICIQTYINKVFTKDEATIRKKDKYPSGINCPLCRTFIDKPDDLDSKDWANVFPINILLNDLIAINRTEKGQQKCNVCESENESEKDIESRIASYWCASCHYAMCASCERQHRKFMSADSHKVIGIDDFQATSPSGLATEMTCKEHKEVYKYYCSDHSLICCMTCFVQKHRHCVRVITVDKAAEAKRESNDETSLMTSLSDLKETYQEMAIDREQNACELRDKLENTRKIVKNYYGSLIRHLSKAESKKLDEIDEYEKQFLPEIQKEKVDMECKVEGIDNNLKLLQITSKYASPAQYLYTMKKMKERKQSLHTKFHSMETIDIHFTPTEALSEMTRPGDKLGNISVFRTKKGEEQKAERKEISQSAQIVAMVAGVKQGKLMNPLTKSANVKPVLITEKSRNRANINQGQGIDKNTTSKNASVKLSLINEIDIDDYITGAALLDDGRMLISKYGNKSLTLIGGDGKELSSLGLDNSTWGIRMISPTEGAVVVFKKCLQFFKVTNNDIVKGNSLRIPVSYDFTFHRNMYYIGGYEMIMVYNSLLRHVRNIPVSDVVGSIAVRDDSSLCYTVLYGIKLYSITMDGIPVFTYSHDKLWDTRGVTVDQAGYIYVCGYESTNIHQLSHDGKQQRIIFNNLPVPPSCLSFNTRRDKAVIGCFKKVLLYNLNSI